MHGVVLDHFVCSWLALWDIERMISDRISKHLAFSRNQRKLNLLIAGLIKASKLNIPSSALSSTVVGEFNKEIERVTGLTQKMGHKLLARALSDVVSDSTFRNLAC